MSEATHFSSLKRCMLIVSAAVLLFLLSCRMQDRYTVSQIRHEYDRDLSSQRERGAGAAGSGKEAPAIADNSGITHSLTLSEAIEAALRNNPDLRRTLHRINRARAMQDLADSAFWPMVGFYTEYLQGDAPSAYLFKTIDQRKLPAQINFNDPGWFENFETGFTARMNLFNGGRDFLTVEMAKQDVALSNLGRQTLLNELTAQVIAAYYNVLAARDFIAIAEASVATVTEQLRITGVHYEGGAALKSDLLSLKVRRAQAEEAVIKSRNRCKLARASLLTLLGMDPSSVSEETKLFSDKIDTDLEVPEQFDEGLARALSSRPELAKIRAQLVKSRMGVDAARAAYLPRVDFMGRWYLDDDDMRYNGNRDNWTAGFTLSWDLFSGFSRQARINKAETSLQELLEADRRATLNVQLDVKTAYLNKEAAEARNTVASKSVESAEETYRLVEQHYKGGAVSITRYLQAELERDRARIRSAAALYEKHKARADVARAIGTWAAQSADLHKRYPMP